MGEFPPNVKTTLPSSHRRHHPGPPGARKDRRERTVLGTLEVNFDQPTIKDGYIMVPEFVQGYEHRGEPFFMSRKRRLR